MPNDGRHDDDPTPRFVRTGRQWRIRVCDLDMLEATLNAQEDSGYVVFDVALLDEEPARYRVTALYEPPEDEDEEEPDEEDEAEAPTTHPLPDAVARGEG